MLASVAWRVMIVAVVVGGAVSAAVGDTLLVPSQYTTIQAAIDAAVAGDEVIIAAGTYTGVGNRDIDFHGKALTVRSTDPNDPAVVAGTVIDCQGSEADRHRAFNFVNGEGRDSKLVGLKIINGCAPLTQVPNLNDAPLGGAILCDMSSPTLDRCVFAQNTSCWGGAIHSGGPVFGTGGSPLLTHCLLTDNVAREYHPNEYYSGSGGAISSTGGSLTLLECRLLRNRAIREVWLSTGGALSLGPNVSLTLADCELSGNSALPTGTGGALDISESTAVVSNCLIRENAAGGNWNSTAGGGAIYSEDSAMLLSNCVLFKNRTVKRGGSIAQDGGTVSATNCTLCGGLAGGGGNGAFCEAGTLTFSNSIVWDGAGWFIGDSSGLTLSHTDVQGGWIGQGNIDADPVFAFVEDPHLMPSSPCVDAGTNDPPSGLPSTDAEGNARLLDGNGDTTALADMGAYEYDPATPAIAVGPPTFRLLALEGGDGPGGRMLLLRNCGGGVLQWTINGLPPWLTAVPSSGSSDGEVDPVTLSVDSSNMVRGAYSATIEVGDLQAVNTPRKVDVAVYVGRVLHVPTEYGTIQAAIDAAGDGDVVEVSDGVYVGTGNRNLDFNGKLITVRGASGDADACVIDCQRSGRGFYFRSGETADCVVEGLTIENGSAVIDSPGGAYGGGVLCNASDPTIVNCALSGNYADYGGGGLGCVGAQVRVVDSMIRGNSTASNGGGFYSSSGSLLVVAQSVIAGNAARVGGGMWCSGGKPRVAQCTVYGNVASQLGGGIYCMGGSNPEVTNCILWADAPGEIYLQSGNPIVTHCDVQGGWPGVGNIALDPLFLTITDLRLQADSQCIDAGDNTAVPGDALDLDADGDTTEPVPFDLAGSPRFVDDPATADCQWAPGTCGEAPIVDMGAYEYQAEPTCRGDASYDGQIDFFDINPFVAALLQQGYRDGSGANADVNGDGAVDFFDINPFVLLLTQNPLPIECP